MPDLPRTAPDVAPAKPDRMNSTRPAAGRVYDFYLGGSSNFTVDRMFGSTVLERAPFVGDFARNNRAFLRRVVRWLCAQGIDQFLDIGSGIPTVGSVHTTVREINPRARTVYVDHEPMTAGNAAVILDRYDPTRERTNILQADLRDPDEILNSPVTRELIDFTRPVGLLILATVHFLGPGDHPTKLLSRYRDALPAGSYLAVSHLTFDGVPEPVWNQGPEVERLYASTPTPSYFRNREEITALFDGFSLVDPGIVWAPQWRPDDIVSTEPAATATLVGAGRLP
jgi:hypothetical protein